MEKDEDSKGAGQGRQQKCPCLTQHPRASNGHTAGAGSAQFISGLAKPTQSPLTEVVLTTSTITSMGQG